MENIKTAGCSALPGKTAFGYLDTHKRPRGELSGAKANMSNDNQLLSQTHTCTHTLQQPDDSRSNIIKALDIVLCKKRTCKCHQTSASRLNETGFIGKWVPPSQCSHLRMFVCIHRTVPLSLISGLTSFLNECRQSCTGDFPGSYLTLGEVTSLSMAQHDLL